MQTNVVVFYIGRLSIISSIEVSDVIFWNSEQLVEQNEVQSFFSVYASFILEKFSEN